MSKEIHLGNQAKRILEDEIFTDAVKKIEDRLNQEWLASPLRDTEAREKIFLMRKMLETIINEITSVMDTGKLANKKLSDIHK
jgi:ribosomal protein S7